MVEYIQLISAIGIISAIVFNILNYQKLAKAHDQSDGEKSGSIAADIKYIMRRTDDIYIDQKDLKKDSEKFNERLTRTEERVKLAHERIDEINKESK